MDLDDFLSANAPPKEIQLSQKELSQLFWRYKNLQRKFERLSQFWQSTNENLQQAYKNLEQVRLLEQKMAAREKEASRLQKMNVQLTQAHDQALEANKAKSYFLATMSHELRTPLNAVLGYTDLLYENIEEMTQTEVREDLQKIRDAAYSLLTLINQVLDLSKIEAGKLEILSETVNIPALLHDIETLMTPLAHKQNNQLIIQVSEQPQTLVSDRQKVQQILCNLVSNACKFTHHGTIILRVENIELEGVPFICFLVQDTGIGIHPDDLEHIFAAFTQVDTSHSRKYEGAGLGLTIASHLATLLGGTLGAQSQLHQGSTFSLRLPMNPEVISP